MHADRGAFSPVSGNAAAVAITAEEKIVYNVRNAAEIVDVSERQMWALVHRGAVKSFKMGRSRRITRAALIAYVASVQDVA